MIRKITNQALPYAWGSKTLISDYLGYTETGEPMAEIWFGTHPGSMAYAEDSGTGLLELRAGRPLSFLLKFLAADQALSIISGRPCFAVQPSSSSIRLTLAHRLGGSPARRA